MIPKKLYYSISEVCSYTGLEQHVLRYWESEFPQLKPKKNRAGNRAYREKDIEIIQYIKHLLYEEKFTIPGAKKKIAENRMHLDPEPDMQDAKAELPVSAPLQYELPLTVNNPVDEIKKELHAILDILKSEKSATVQQ